MLRPVFEKTSSDWFLFRALGYLSPISVVSQNPHFHKILHFIYFGEGLLCVVWLKCKFSGNSDPDFFGVLSLTVGTLVAMFLIMTASALFVPGAVVYPKNRHGIITPNDDHKSDI